MLPQSFIDDVKKNTDILKLVREFVDLKKVGDGIWAGVCPHPGHDDSSPSFTVWERDQSWCCLGCHQGKKDKSSRDKNYGSDCFAFVQWMSLGKTNWKEAILQLAKVASIPVPTDESREFYDRNLLLATSYMKSLHGQALNYLLKRGMTREDMVRWKLGFDGKKITFPLLDRYQNVLGFTKRWLDMPEGRHDKYRNSANSKIFNKGYYLYGIQNITDDCDEVRITEGPADVILSEKYGALNMLGTLGTSFTEGHIEIIKLLGKTPVFCMDGDAAGLKSMYKSVEALAKAGVYSKLLILPNGMDMAELALELKGGLEQHIQDHAITYGYYKIRQHTDQFDAKTNELKLKLYPDILRMLDEVPGDERIVLREFVKQKLQMEL